MPMDVPLSSMVRSHGVLTQMEYRIDRTATICPLLFGTVVFGALTGF